MLLTLGIKYIIYLLQVINKINLIKIFSFLIIFFGLGFFWLIKVNAASYDFSPASKTFIQGCTNEVVVLIDTEGASSNAADIEIYYNQNEIDIIDKDASIPGKQVTPGDAYQVYVYNQADNGVIKVAAGSFVGSHSGVGSFIKIPFKSKAGVTSTSFSINFTSAGDTLDSNIADTATSNDLLTSVTNATYSFTTGFCVPDTSPPTINYSYPRNGSTGVPANANLSLVITDNLSGVDIDTVEVSINGEDYNTSDPEFSFTGDPLRYAITIDPRVPIPQGVASSITTKAIDFSLNTRRSTITFNIPPPPTPTPPPPDNNPVIATINPLNRDIIDDFDMNINFNLSDDYSGIDLNKTFFILNGQEFTPSSENVSYSGDQLNYDFTLDPIDSLPSNETSYLTIYTQDKGGHSAFVVIQFGPLIEELPETGECPECICPSIPPSIEYIDGGGSENYSEPVGIPGIISILLALASVLSLLYLLTTPYFLFGIFSKGNNKPWGVVFHAQSDTPLKGVNVVLQSLDGITKLGESISDLYGRFQFNDNPGDYRVELTKRGFKTEDYTIRHVAEGSLAYLELKENQAGVLGNIIKGINKLIRFLQKQNLAIALVGLVLALVSYAFYPTILAMLLIIYYMVWSSISAVYQFIRS